MGRLKYYIRVWYLMSRNSFSMVLSQRVAVIVFVTGKVLRFGFYSLLLYFILNSTKTLSGYTVEQTFLFFLTFNVVDVVSQFLYRGVYHFRPKLISGDFDLTLTKPVKPLFTSLAGGADILDFVTIPPLIAGTIYVGYLLDPSVLQVLTFVALLLNSFIIATAFYILVLCFGILTFEVDNIVMVYRELTSLGRFPIDIYGAPLREFLTYVIPVGIMLTFPGKALMGILSPFGILVSFVFGFGLLFASFKLWELALRKYTSASS